MAYARTAPRWDPSPSRDWTEPSSGFWFLNLCCAMREVRRGSAGARPQRRAASARPLRSEAEPGLALRGVGNGRAGPNPGPSPGSRTRDSARKDRAQSRPKVFRVSGSGHIGEGRSGRPVFARERPPFRSSGLRFPRCNSGCLKVPLPIWPLPETPSTGVRPWGAVVSCGWARPVRPNPIKPGRAGGSGGRARGEGGMAPEGRPGARSARGSLRPWMQKL